VVSLQVAATDSATGQALTYAAAGLPAGLSINPATGLISGTTTTVCDCDSAVTVSDATGATTSVAFPWTVTNKIVMTNPGQLKTPPDSAVTLQIQATDKTPGQTLTYTATGLPAGLSINMATGLISGTTGDIARYVAATVMATDTAGASFSVEFPWLVEDLITVTVPWTGIEQLCAGDNVSRQVTATDSAGLPVTFTAEGLPPGLSIDPTTGLISGVVTTTAGFYPCAITATDSTGSLEELSVYWNVGGMITVANPGSQTNAVGTVAQLHLDITDTATSDELLYDTEGLPPGIVLDTTTREFVGYPSTEGVSDVELLVTDAYGGNTVVIHFTWTVTRRTYHASDRTPVPPVRLSA
jgi:hypothetical protein